jgi:hypothetical protein
MIRKDYTPMYDGVKHNLSQGSKKDLKGWDRLIAEAKDQIRDLERAVKHFEQNKAKGEPYFGEQGVKMLRPFESTEEVLSQDGVLGQSQQSGYSVNSGYCGVTRGSTHSFLKTFSEVVTIFLQKIINPHASMPTTRVVSTLALRKLDI